MTLVVKATFHVYITTQIMFLKLRAKDVAVFILDCINTCVSFILLSSGLIQFNFENVMLAIDMHNVLDSDLRL
jgi:hypothetical protein